MRRIALFVPGNYMDELKKIAGGRPVSELIRQAILEYITKHSA